MLAAFGVFRRPARPSDRIPRVVRERLAGSASRIDVGYVRLLVSHGHARAYLIPGMGGVESFIPYRCSHESRARYERQRRAYERQRRQAERTPVLCVAGDRPGVPELGCAPSRSILAAGQIVTSDRGRAPATVTMLLPDRVATIIPVYKRGRRVSIPLYTRRTSCVAHARHNIATYQLKRPAPTATPATVLWFDRHGNLIKRANSHGQPSARQPRCTIPG